jgi:hypothetical protein
MAADAANSSAVSLLVCEYWYMMWDSIISRGGSLCCPASTAVTAAQASHVPGPEQAVISTRVQHCRLQQVVRCTTAVKRQQQKRERWSCATPAGNRLLHELSITGSSVGEAQADHR